MISWSSRWVTGTNRPTMFTCFINTHIACLPLESSGVEVALKLLHGCGVQWPSSQSITPNLKAQVLQDTWSFQAVFLPLATVTFPISGIKSPKGTMHLDVLPTCGFVVSSMDVLEWKDDRNLMRIMKNKSRHLLTASNQLLAGILSILTC
jgi:hypothetical protein